MHTYIHTYTFIYFLPERGVGGCKREVGHHEGKLEGGNAVNLGESRIDCRHLFKFQINLRNSFKFSCSIFATRGHAHYITIIPCS